MRLLADRAHVVETSPPPSLDLPVWRGVLEADGSLRPAPRKTRPDDPDATDASENTPGLAVRLR